MSYTTFIQEGNPVKYNKDQNNILGLAITTKNKTSVGTVNDFDTTQQSLKPCQLSGTPFSNIQLTSDIKVIMDNDEQKVIADEDHGNLMIVVDANRIGFLINVDDTKDVKLKGKVRDLIALINKNKIKSIQLYSKKVSSSENYITNINSVDVISVNTI